MVNQPLVSILMNCHNGEDFLNESIGSVLKQSYQNWELIFFDNASNDSSREIFNSFSDKRLKYFYQPNKSSLVEARNIAVERCSADWIAILDTDDSWHQEKLQEQINVIKNSQDFKNIGLIFTKAEINCGKNKKTISRSFKSKKFLDDLLTTNLSIPWSSTIFNKKLFYEVGKFDKNFPNFHDFALELSIASFAQIIFVDKPLTYIKIHNDSLSAKQKFDSSNYFSENKLILKDYFPRKSAIDGFYILTVKAIIFPLLQFDFVNFFKELSKLSLKEIIFCSRASVQIFKSKFKKNFNS